MADIEKKKTNGKQMDDFLMELIRFFKSSICGTAESVKTLIGIEENFPEEYKEIRKSKLDPSQIDKIMDDMDDKEKETFFMIFIKASLISPKLSRLFDLDLREKKELADEIENFADFVEKKLMELSEK